MCSASPSPADTLWTIGHSNHPLEVFLDLLAQHHIELLVDVRSSPYSGYAAQFNREAIGPALRGRAVAYRYLGDRLARMRCKVRRCMLRRRAVSDTLWPHNS